MRGEKLPSGSWRCRVYWYTDENGKKHYKTFTCQDPSPKGKKMVEAEASAWALEKPDMNKKKLKVETTFDDALTKYIEERSHVLSPSSIRKYKAMQRNHFDEIKEKKLISITQDDIQNMVNRMATSHSPKTIKDVHGLITAVLKRNSISLMLNTTMPKKRRNKVYIPTDNDIKKLLDTIKGTDMELVVMLGAFAGMRRGEISSLLASDLDGNVIHITKTMVDTDDHSWIVKTPKSYAGDRFVAIPQFVADMFPKKGNVTELRPNMITSRFEHCLKQAGIPHFRFHDLRHYNCSILNILGVPEQYILSSLGWSNDRVMKEVYRHTMTDHDYSNVAASYFERMSQGMSQDEKK